MGTAPIRIVVSGSLRDGKLVRIWVPDRTRASDYSANVVEGSGAGYLCCRTSPSIGSISPARRRNAQS